MHDEDLHTSFSCTFKSWIQCLVCESPHEHKNIPHWWISSFDATSVLPCAQTCYAAIEAEHLQISGLSWECGHAKLHKSSIFSRLGDELSLLNKIPTLWALQENCANDEDRYILSSKDQNLTTLPATCWKLLRDERFCALTILKQANFWYSQCAQHNIGNTI